MPRRPSVVISESDLENALDYLRGLPYSGNMPYDWDRHRLMSAISMSLHGRPRIGDCAIVAPGVWSIVYHLGFDIVADATKDGEERLQVVLAVREAQTDLNAVRVLS